VNRTLSLLSFKWRILMVIGEERIKQKTKFNSASFILMSDARSNLTLSFIFNLFDPNFFIFLFLSLIRGEESTVNLIVYCSFFYGPNGRRRVFVSFLMSDAFYCISVRERVRGDVSGWLEGFI